MFMHVQHILNDALQSDDKYLQPVPTAGRDSSVGREIRHGLDGPGIEARLRGDFPHLSRPALRPTQPPAQWVLDLFPGGKAAGAWR